MPGFKLIKSLSLQMNFSRRFSDVLHLATGCIFPHNEVWATLAGHCHLLLGPECDVHIAIPRHCSVRRPHHLSAFSLGGDATLTDEHDVLIILHPQHMPFSFNTFGRRASSTL